MAEIYDWDVVADRNNAASPDGWPENAMAPRAVNDAGRELMAVIARYREASEVCTETTGSATAYALATMQEIDALEDGMRFAFCAHVSSTDAATTLQIDDLGAVSLVGTRTAVDGSENLNLFPGEILAGYIYVCSYLGGNFYLLNPSISSTAGQVSADRIPTPLTGKDADSVDGFHVSTDAEGDNASTLYFRS